MRLPPSREVRFPNLSAPNYSVSSPETDNYNCIAWAYGVDDRKLWPGVPDDYVWPDGLPQQEDIDTFIALFVGIGYEVCSSPDLEQGFEKVAIFANGDEPLHAARQLLSGKWTSKLGDWQDIEHDDLAAVEGNRYGQVNVILRRHYG